MDFVAVRTFLAVVRRSWREWLNDFIPQEQTLNFGVPAET